MVHQLLLPRWEKWSINVTCVPEIKMTKINLDKIFVNRKNSSLISARQSNIFMMSIRAE